MKDGNGYRPMKTNHLLFITVICAATMFAAGCKKETATPQGDQYITIQPESVSASWEGQIIDVQVKSNCSWTISKTDVDGTVIDWVKCDRASGDGDLAFKIRVYKNPTGEKRQATVTLFSEDIKAFIDVSQDANPNPGQPDDPDDPPTPSTGYKMPIAVFMKTNNLDVESGAILAMEGSSIANASLDGNVLTFTDGATIEKTGADGGLVFLNPAHTNPKSYAGFQLAVAAYSWAAGDSWLIKVPVTESVSGDLRFFYGSRREANLGGTTYAWSSDKGTTWNTISEAPVGGGSDAMWKSVDFNIPSGNAVPVGGEFWFRITYAGDCSATAAGKTVCFSNGFALLPQKAQPTQLPMEDDTKVLFSEGFDDLQDAKAAYIDIDAPLFKSLATGKKSTNVYASTKSYVNITRCYGRPGFLQVGYADEAIVGDYLDPGIYSINVGARLKEMNLGSATVKLSLKAGGITTAYGERVDAKPVINVSKGSVSADGAMDALPMDAWKDYSFTVTDVDQSTVLNITSDIVESATSICGKIDYRFFIDDILIVVSDGSDDPEDDPVTPPSGDNLVLSFDFSIDPLDGWPTAANYEHKDGGIECVYPLDGTNYTFILADCDGASKAQMFWATTDPGNRLAFGAQYRYLGFPAIDGYKLTKVSCESILLNASSSAISPKMAITNKIAASASDAKAINDESDDIVPGGEFQTWIAGGGGSYTYNLSETESNTVYYMYALVKGAISSLELTYSK